MRGDEHMGHAGGSEGGFQGQPKRPHQLADIMGSTVPLELPPSLRTCTRTRGSNPHTQDRPLGVASAQAEGGGGVGSTGGRALRLHSPGPLAAPREGPEARLLGFTELVCGESLEPRKLCWAGGSPHVQLIIKTERGHSAENRPSLGRGRNPELAGGLAPSPQLTQRPVPRSPPQATRGGGGGQGQRQPWPGPTPTASLSSAPPEPILTRSVLPERPPPPPCRSKRPLPCPPVTANSGVGTHPDPLPLPQREPFPPTSARSCGRFWTDRPCRADRGVLGTLKGEAGWGWGVGCVCGGSAKSEGREEGNREVLLPATPATPNPEADTQASCPGHPGCCPWC